MVSVAIIPARMGSSRFPGKPLAKIAGMPMIGHIWHRTSMCESLAGTYVATCDQEIMDYVNSIGGKAIMTSDKHERCSDRCAEAILEIEKELGEKVDIVAMVQGDEVLVTPEMIDLSLREMKDNQEINVTNLMAPIRTDDEFQDPNEVKVVVNPQNEAIYFSREAIPSPLKGATNINPQKQVCIICFRRDYLLRFNDLPTTPLEQIESVDMLRIIENGEKVKMIPMDLDTVAVDTPADLEAASKIMAKDPLVNQYL